MFKTLTMFFFKFKGKENSGDYNFSSISEWLLIYFAIFLTGTLAVEISQIKGINVSVSLNEGDQILTNEDDISETSDPTQIPSLRFKNKKVTNSIDSNENRVSYNDKANILEMTFIENT